MGVGESKAANVNNEKIRFSIRLVRFVYILLYMYAWVSAYVHSYHYLACGQGFQ